MCFSIAQRFSHLSHISHQFLEDSPQASFLSTPRRPRSIDKQQQSCNGTVGNEPATPCSLKPSPSNFRKQLRKFVVDAGHLSHNPKRARRSGRFHVEDSPKRCARSSKALDGTLPSQHGSHSHVASVDQHKLSLKPHTTRQRLTRKQVLPIFQFHLLPPNG